MAAKDVVREGRHSSGPTTQRRAYNKKPAPKNDRNTFRFRGPFVPNPGARGIAAIGAPRNRRWVNERKKAEGREELDSDNKRIKRVTSFSIPKGIIKDVLSESMTMGGV